MLLNCQIEIVWQDSAGFPFLRVVEDGNCGVPSSDAVQKQVSPRASCRVLGKFDICVNFAVVISRGADKNTNFAKQLQDIVGLQETGKKKKRLWIQLKSNSVPQSNISCKLDTLPLICSSDTEDLFAREGDMLAGQVKAWEKEVHVFYSGFNHSTLSTFFL